MSLKDLLNEVSGAAPASQTTKPAKAPKRPSMTAKAIQRILSLFVKHDKMFEAEKKAKADRERLRGLLRPLVQKFGVESVERPGDLLLYVHPYKVSLEQVTEKGGVNAVFVMEWARKNIPELIIHQIDLGLLKSALEREDAPDTAKQKYRDAIRLVEKMVASFDDNKGLSEERLDLGRYEEAKRKNLIPQDVLSEAEPPAKSYTRLSKVEKFTGKNRCKACGEKKKQTQKTANYVCPRCATPE